MSLLEQLGRRISAHGGLIVSCQPVPGSPLDTPAIVAAMALAAEQAWQRWHCVLKVLRICGDPRPGDSTHYRYSQT